MTGIRQFPISVVITAIDGKLIAPMDQVHEFYDYVTGETLFTHQLPRVAAEVDPWLRSQHPDLAAVTVPKGLDSWEKVDAFLAPLRDRFGDTVGVTPIPAEDHTSIDPISELRMMRPNAEVVIVRPPEEDEQ